MEPREGRLSGRMAPKALRWLLAVAATVALLLFTYTALHTIRAEVRDKAGRALTTVLNTAHQAVSNWGQGVLVDTRLWAEVPELVAATEALLATDRTPQSLLATVEQRQLRDLLRPVLNGKRFEGFFVIGPQYTSLASTRDANTGTVNLMAAQPGLLQRVFSGESVLSLPQFSDVPLPDETGTLVDRRATMFTLAPVRNAAGKVIAALAFRINPEREFSNMVSYGRIGESGETYAFNRDGLLISDSRFDETLRKTGRIGPGETGMLNLRLQDPGRLLRSTRNDDDDPASWPLTVMAASATAGERGMQLDPYRDYRGVEVVGAWLWDQELGFGLTTETDAGEIFADYRDTRTALLTLGSLGVVAILLLAGLFEYAERLQLRTQGRIRKVQLEYQGLFENVDLPIWEEDLRGVWHALERLRESGVVDLRHHLEGDPEALERLIAEVRVIRINDAARALFGADAWLQLGSSSSSRLTELFDRHLFIDKLCAIWSREGLFRVETTLTHRSGTPRAVIYSLRLPQDAEESGSLPVTLYDLTELRLAEQQVIQASKLATLGEMATSVAHELNQPLHVIRLATRNLLRRAQAGEPVDSRFVMAKGERIDQQVSRAAKITDHMRIFGRRSVEAPGPIDPVDAVRLAIDLVGEQMRNADIELRSQLPAECPRVIGHSVQLEQVILNLVTNARDAIEARPDPGERWISLAIECDPEQVRIRIEDTGGGIPESVIERIFEPFFTTKEVGKGTGLGLSVSYGIIRDMGGEFVAGNTELGARFDIRLPTEGRYDFTKEGETA